MCRPTDKQDHNEGCKSKWPTGKPPQGNRMHLAIRRSIKADREKTRASLINTQSQCASPLSGPRFRETQSAGAFHKRLQHVFVLITPWQTNKPNPSQHNFFPYKAFMFLFFYLACFRLLLSAVLWSYSWQLSVQVLGLAIPRGHRTQYHPSLCPFSKVLPVLSDPVKKKWKEVKIDLFLPFYNGRVDYSLCLIEMHMSITGLLIEMLYQWG